MKIKALLLTLAVATTLFAGCAAKEDTTKKPAATATPAATAKPAATATPAAKTEATTTASIVNENAAFKKAISKDGTWIICTLKDLTFTEELVLEGDLKNGKKDDKGNDIIQRKIAPYTQQKDAAGKNVVVDRFTITAPKLTVKSANGRIQAGTFKGDLYVDVKDFQLVDATVDGNVYFTSEEAKSTFKMDATSKVTGKQEIKK